MDMNFTPFDSGEELLLDCMTVSELAAALEGLSIIEMVAISSDAKVKIVVRLEQQQSHQPPCFRFSNALEEDVARAWKKVIFYVDPQLRRVGLRLLARESRKSPVSGR